jgi:hypothetical protein
MVAEAEISVLKDLNFARKSLIEALNVAAAEDANARGTLTGRLHENARIRGQITGELSRSPLIQQNTINLVMNSPEFVRFQADLIRVLNRFPDAREAVIAEFDRLEAEQAAQPLPALEHESDDETDQAA